MVDPQEPDLRRGHGGLAHVVSQTPRLGRCKRPGLCRIRARDRKNHGTRTFSVAAAQPLTMWRTHSACRVETFSTPADSVAPIQVSKGSRHATLFFFKREAFPSRDGHGAD